MLPSQSKTASLLQLSPVPQEPLLPHPAGIVLVPVPHPLIHPIELIQSLNIVRNEVLGNLIKAFFNKESNNLPFFFIILML